ncbi:MAG: NBR1-Ig-like domain-containing protein, partial [Anaerolineales bacterium]
MLVRKSLRRILLMLLTAAVALTACNVGAAPVPTVDVNAVNTAAFATALAQISGQQTQTALAAPSATPSPTNTTASPLITVAAGNGTILPPATVSFLNPNTTPLAGFTPLASPAAPAATVSLGDACNNNAFEGDITIPDGSVIEPGVNFQKVWKLRNTGTCLWDDGYSLVYIGGSKPDLDPYTFNFSKTKDNDFVPGGEAINIAINLTSPCT